MRTVFSAAPCLFGVFMSEENSAMLDVRVVTETGIKIEKRLCYPSLHKTWSGDSFVSHYEPELKDGEMFTVSMDGTITITEVLK